MRTTLILLAASLLPATVAAYDVTTPEARKTNLLDYVASRSDLSSAEKKDWDKALRLEFGGAAIKDGTDEGVTVAKSVVSAAIFFHVEPKKAAKAAFDAYHDTYRWVPPPVAVNYQILAMQGRKPKATARQLAFEFPRYFNEDIAVDLANWWDYMLSTKQIPEIERNSVETTLKETRDLMRPMLRERLWQASELEAREQWLKTSGANREQLEEVRKAFATLKDEVHKDFAKVGRSSAVQNESASYYDRYRALCQELGEKPKTRTVYAGPVAPPKATPQPEAQKLPEPAKPVEHKVAETKPAEAKPPVAKPETASPAPVPDNVIAEVKEVAAQEKSQRNQGQQNAPLPGDPLVPLFAGWQGTLNGTVNRWIGTPYLWGGVDHHGIDCSGFSRQVFREAFNLELPRNSRAQAVTGKKVEQRELRAGDLVFFDTMDRGQVTHVGVFLGDGVFAHASSSVGVTRSELNKPYHQRAYWSSRRILKN